MNGTTLLTVKINKQLKEAASQTAKKLGLPLGTAVNAFLKQFVRDKEITLSASYVPTPYLRNILREAKADYENGKTGTFESLEDFFKSF